MQVRRVMSISYIFNSNPDMKETISSIGLLGIGLLCLLITGGVIWNWEIYLVSRQTILVYFGFPLSLACFCLVAVSNRALKAAFSLLVLVVLAVLLAAETWLSISRKQSNIEYEQASIIQLAIKRGASADPRPLRTVVLENRLGEKSSYPVVGAQSFLGHPRPKWTAPMKVGDKEIVQLTGVRHS